MSAARDMAVAAGQLPDPTLRAGIDNLPLGGADRFSLGSDFMTMRRIGLMQEFTRLGKRRARAQRYEGEAAKSQATRLAIATQIERDTALAWLERYYAEQMASLVAEQAVQAGLAIDAADSAYRAGRASQADLLKARSVLALVKDRASEIGRRVRNAGTMLARWTGADPGTPLIGLPALDVIGLDPASLERQLENHPQVAVMNRQQDIAQADATLAKANRTPDWSVEVAFQQRGSAYSNMVSVGVSIPLQWDRKNRQDRELSASLSLLEQAKAERDETLREQVATTRVLVNEWENNRERRARYQKEVIPLAEARTEATVTAYRGGKASLADVLEARRNDIDVRLEALQLETETARLWAQLNFLIPKDAK